MIEMNEYSYLHWLWAWFVLLICQQLVLHFSSAWVFVELVQEGPRAPIFVSSLFNEYIRIIKNDQPIIFLFSNGVDLFISGKIRLTFLISLEPIIRFVTTILIIRGWLRAAISILPMLSVAIECGLYLCGFIGGPIIETQRLKHFLTGLVFRLK